MSFPQYPAYKPSGVEWLGDVPAHWSVTPLLGVAYECDEPNEGLKEDNLLSLSYGRIVKKDMSSNDGLLPESFETYQIVRSGDIVLRLTDLQNDQRSLRTALVGNTGIITSAYLVVRPTGIKSGYFAHLLRCYDVTKVFYSMGGGLRQSMKYSDVKRLPILAPPEEEQALIAAFLDRETAKIDALIAEQEKLLALLSEKRQATISNAVTRGLNPNVAMKDSGAAWLGDVPVHWMVVPVKFVARMESGHTPDKKVEAYWLGGDIPWVSLNDTGFLKDNDFIEETAFSVTQGGIDNSSARLLPAETVVLSRDATIGRCAITVRPMTVSQHFIAWICGDRILPEYLLRVFRSMSQELERRATGATVKTIGMPDVRELVTPVPPVEEQMVIVEHVRASLSRLDKLQLEMQSGIALLKERRSALIAAAVMGAIDVREAG